MEKGFLDVLKEMGIFLLCIQSLMYFSSGKAYEKYIRMLSGMIILAQFIAPVTRILSPASAQGGWMEELWKEAERFEAEMEQKIESYQQMFDGNSEMEMEAVWKRETKKHLQQKAEAYGYRVMDVSVLEEEGRICIFLEDTAVEKEEMIRIRPVTVGGSSPDPEAATEVSEELREAFAHLLGTEENCLEIILQQESKAGRQHKSP